MEKDEALARELDKLAKKEARLFQSDREWAGTSQAHLPLCHLLDVSSIIQQETASP